MQKSGGVIVRIPEKEDSAETEGVILDANKS
jgi:hypothetical protein